MKNILVSGGAGFIGSNLIKKLIDEGHNVTSLDNYSTGFKLNNFVLVFTYSSCFFIQPSKSLGNCSNK